MTRRPISTDQAPAAIGPYSQAVAVDGWLFTAGQLGLDPATGEFVSGGVQEQTRRALENAAAILADAGSGFADVVKTTVFLKDMNDFAAMNEIYAEFFAQDPPARSAVQVAKLPKDGLVEIEIIARIG